MSHIKNSFTYAKKKLYFKIAYYINRKSFSNDTKTEVNMEIPLHAKAA